MKKFLLSLAAASLALSVSADKVAFVAADAEEFYDGDAKTVIVIPNGYYLTTSNDRAPQTPVVKALSSSVVKIDAAGAGDFGFKTASKASKSYVTSGGFRWYTNQALTFTPAKGITLKGIKVRTQRLNDTSKIPSNYAFPFTKDVADTKIDGSNATNVTLTASLDTAEPITLQPTGQIRCYYIELEYEGTLGQASMPVCSAKLPFVTADEEILLTSDAGTDIYYTLDGSVPSLSSTKYSAPFKLDKDAIIRAIAVKDGVESFPFYGEYFVVPSGVKTAEFNLTAWQNLTKKDGTKFAAADFQMKDGDNAPCNMWIPVNGVELADKDVALSFKDVSNDKQTQIFKSWTFGNIVEYRPNDATNTLTVSVPEGCKLSNIIVVGSNLEDTSDKNNPNVFKLADNQKGVFALSPVNKANGMWSTGADETASVTFAGGTYINQIYVAYTGEPSGSGVAGIEAEENAPVEYYNLQGIRVANPENGLYIVKQGNKVTKRVIK